MRISCLFKGARASQYATCASAIACLIISNACSGDVTAAGLRGGRWPASIFAAATASAWARPSRLPLAAACNSRVNCSASAGAARKSRIMWSYQRSRQLPANSEPVYRPAELLTFPMA